MNLITIVACESVRETVARFGRVGILIDDARGAASRLATELYGTSALPMWWMVADSVDGGETLLAELVELIGEEEPFPYAVVMDRYLPITRGERPVKWWGYPDSRAEKLQKAKALLPPDAIFIGISAFPTLEEEGLDRNSGEPRWYSRSDAPVLRRIRGTRSPKENENVAEELLTFGPDMNMDIEWVDLLKRLTTSLRNFNEDPEKHHEDVVLLSGAGMSLSDSDTSAGMLANEKLTAAAIQWALRTRDGAKSFLFRELKKDASDFSKGVCALSDGSGSGQPGVRVPFNRLWGEFESSSATVIQLRRQAELGLRVAVTANDRGITHQHFLAAQLPFRLIVTTNFDGQHERAAVLAASRDPLKATSYIARGLAIETPGQRVSSSGIEPRLLRLYGSIASGQPLAIKRNEFDERLDWSLPAVGGLKPKRTLLVVGHSLDDDALIQWLLDMEFTRVIYVAFGVSRDGIGAAGSLKETLLRSATVVDCRAIDLFYDLSEKFKSSG